MTLARLAFLAGGGEMGQRMRSRDWKQESARTSRAVATIPEDHSASHARLPLRHVDGMGR
jgi:hypothetical protein